MVIGERLLNTATQPYLLNQAANVDYMYLFMRLCSCDLD